MSQFLKYLNINYNLLNIKLQLQQNDSNLLESEFIIFQKLNCLHRVDLVSQLSATLGWTNVLKVRSKELVI